MTEDSETTHVVTVFLRHDADVLLCRRSDEAGSDSGRWDAVVGEEMREETGLHLGVDATRLRRGDPFEVTDPDLGRRRVVHPFLCEAATREVTTTDETAAHEWVPPTAILRRETVPDLWTAYDRVRPTVETVTADRDHGSAYLSVRALEVLRDEAALAAERDAGEWADLAATARALRDARPAMPVVANRVNRVMAAAVERAGNGRPVPATVERAAGDELDRALAADDRAAARAAELLPSRVATLSRSGTVLAALERADPAFVLVAESRPGREGVATAEALAAQTTADVTLTTDAALADEIAVADVRALVVGADAVLPDGRVVNKVGTRGAACVTASECAVYVVAAGDKVATDGSVDREERPAAEVYDGDVDLSIANPTFGVTPPGCLDAVVTEDGVLDEAGVHELADAHRERARWDAGDPTG
jgi:translation initiation factor 2B subunit (eIF-2B alpha/beta/delta family)